MKRQLALVREEQEQSARANEALGAPSRASLESMMASIGHNSRTPLSMRTGWDRIAEFFARADLPRAALGSRRPRACSC